MYFRNKIAEFSTPYPAKSQLLFRLSLAYKRTNAYPLDSMDFLLADLKRPGGYIRAAQGCEGDLSGRVWDFWTMCRTVNLPDFDEERYRELTEEILSTANDADGLGSQDYRPIGADTACAMVTGLCRCYESTGDPRLLRFIDGYQREILREGSGFSRQFGGQSLAELYYHTNSESLRSLAHDMAEQCWRDYEADPHFHTHSMLRGMAGYQMLAMVTGDMTFAEVPERIRRLILREGEIPCGDVCEYFPASILNEGCSTADWLRINMNSGLLTGDDSAYETAENTLWNALLLVQANNGGFGHRVVGQNGYPGGKYVEAWWCCLHNAGRTLAECYLHTVIRRKDSDAICVNFLIPGRYVLEEAGITAEIETEYPFAPTTTIRFAGLKEGQEIRVRIPKYLRCAKTDIVRDGDRAEVKITGKMGYTVTPEDGGAVLRYGPMVLAPTILGFEPEMYRKGALLQGIFTDVKWESSESMMQTKGRLKMILPAADGDGLIPLPFAGFGRWTYADEGRFCQDAEACVSTYVKLRLGDGKVGDFCFYPVNYFTRGSSFGDIITVFDLEK